MTGRQGKDCFARWEVLQTRLSVLLRAPPWSSTMNSPGAAAIRNTSPTPPRPLSCCAWWILLARLASCGGLAARPALLVHELGMLPPGTLGKLASGEIAVALGRGNSGNTLIVSAVMNRQGDVLGSPVQRDTASAGFAIKGTVATQQLRAKRALHQLCDCPYDT